MPLSALLVDNTNVTFYNGDAACQIPITPSSETGVILGNSSLRFAYLVYYIENNEIAVAQAVLDAASTSNIVTIPSGTGLPGVSPTATLILSDTMYCRCHSCDRCAWRNFIGRQRKHLAHPNIQPRRINHRIIYWQHSIISSGCGACARFMGGGNLYWFCVFGSGMHIVMC